MKSSTKPVKSEPVALLEPVCMHIPEKGDETDYHTLLVGIPAVPLHSTDNALVADLRAWCRKCFTSVYKVKSLELEQNVLEMAVFHMNLCRRSAFTMFAHLYGSLLSDLIAWSNLLLCTENSQSSRPDKRKARTDPIDIDFEGSGEGSSEESKDEDEYLMGHTLAGQT
jgi:hypothetical protein